MELGFAATRLEAAVSWARRSSLFAYPFGGACCGPELLAASGPRYAADVSGLGLPQWSPRQADLLLVVGTITQRQAPVLRTVYDQMAEPKWVAAIGACACAGGPYDNYATVERVDAIVPVDVYVAGCPPRPEALIEGLSRLRARIGAEPGWRRPRHRRLDELEKASP